MDNLTIPANVPEYLHPFWQEPDVTERRDAEYFTKTTRLALGQLDQFGVLDLGPDGAGFGVRDVPISAERHIRERLEHDPKYANYRTMRARKMIVRQGPPPEFTAYVADALAAGRIDSQGADEMHGVWVRVHNRMALQPNRHEGAYEYAVQQAWIAATMDDLREFWAKDHGIPEAQARWEAHVATLSDDEQATAQRIAAEATQKVEEARAERAEQVKEADRQEAAAQLAAATIEHDQATQDRHRAAELLASAREERKAATVLTKQAEEARADAAALLRRAETARHHAEEAAAQAAHEWQVAEDARNAKERAERRAEAAEMARAEAEAARLAAAEAAAARETEQESCNRSLRGRWSNWRHGTRS